MRIFVAATRPSAVAVTPGRGPERPDVHKGRGRAGHRRAGVGDEQYVLAKGERVAEHGRRLGSGGGEPRGDVDGGGGGVAGGCGVVSGGGGGGDGGVAGSGGGGGVDGSGSGGGVDGEPRTVVASALNTTIEPAIDTALATAGLTRGARRRGLGTEQG